MRGSILGELTARAYEAGAEPARWSEFLDLLREQLRAESCTLQLHDLQNATGSIAVGSGVDPAVEHAYNSYYGALNPWTNNARGRMDPGRVLTSEMAISPAELERTEFYADFLRPSGLRHSVAAVIRRDGDAVAFLAVQLSARRGACDTRDLRLLTRLMPHLRRAMELHRRVGVLTQERRALLDALDRVTWGVLFLDRRGRVLFANRVATGFDQATVELILRVAARGGGAAIRHPRPPLLVTSAPLRIPDPLGGIEPPTDIVFVVDPGKPGQLSERWLREGYGLTAAEARLALALAHGDSLENVSNQTGTRVSTLRTHLKSVFEKTRTNRQSELVRLVLLGAEPE